MIFPTRRRRRHDVPTKRAACRHRPGRHSRVCEEPFCTGRACRRREVRGVKDGGGMEAGLDARTIPGAAAAWDGAALTSALDNEHRPGLFACAACDLPL